MDRIRLTFPIWENRQNESERHTLLDDLVRTWQKSWYLRHVSQVWRELLAAGLHAELAVDGWRGLLKRAKVTWSIDYSQIGPGYAVPTPAGERVVALGDQHGFHLETTYTGKCGAALQADLAAGQVGPVLLWNTHAGTDLAALARPGWESRLPTRLQRLLG